VAHEKALAVVSVSMNQQRFVGRRIADGPASDRKHQALDLDDELIAVRSDRFSGSFDPFSDLPAETG